MSSIWNPIKSRQLDHLETENERLRERPKPVALAPSAKSNVFDQSDTSEDDEVQRLKQEIKSHETKASHTKIARNEYKCVLYP